MADETFALCGHNVSFAELKGIRERESDVAIRCCVPAGAGVWDNA